VPVRYAAMAQAGYFDRKELLTLRQFGSRLQGHPERLRLPGLETTSGPLGCGLSQACGIALAQRMDNITHRWVYVVMGDGEINEGNIWEAAMLASKYHLNNVIGILDRNNIQIDGPTELVMPLEDLRGKWEAFWLARPRSQWQRHRSRDRRLRHGPFDRRETGYDHRPYYPRQGCRFHGE